MVLPASILGTASLLPGPAVSTAQVCATAWPARDPAELQARCGIATRHWAPPGTTAASLGTTVLQAALARAGLVPGQLRRFIFVTSTGGDQRIPATANAISEAVGLDRTCDSFDLNNACMGFLSAFDLATRCVATGLGPVGIVVVELLSRHIGPEARRSYAVLADACAAVVVGAATQPGAGVEGSWLANIGAYRGSVTLAAEVPGTAAQRIQFGSSNARITQEALEAVTTSSQAALQQAGCTLAQVDWVLAHQPNGVMLDRIAATLGVPPDKLVPVVGEIGSVGAASIPVSLDRLWRSGRLRAGQRVLLVGVGSGMSYGAVVLRLGAVPA